MCPPSGLDAGACGPLTAPGKVKMERTFSGYSEEDARKQRQVGIDQLAEQGWTPVAETVTKEVRRRARDLIHVTVSFERTARRPAVAVEGSASSRSSDFVPPAQRPYASTNCPACSAPFDPPPKRKTSCLQCGTVIFVRSGPDGMRHLLHEPGMLAMQAAWDAQAMDRYETRDARSLGQRPATPRRVHFEVVGESHYQDTLANAVGGRGEEPVDHPCVVFLIPEPTNPYDKKAVRVVLGGQTVGYLSRSAASADGPVAGLLAGTGNHVRCKARIVGGWNRGMGDIGSFGILVDLPTADELRTHVEAGRWDLA